MKLHNLALIIVGCTLAANCAALQYKLKKAPQEVLNSFKNESGKRFVGPYAKREIKNSQRFEDFYGLDTFSFNNEVYFVLINEEGAELHKLSNSKVSLIPAHFLSDRQKLIQYKIDAKGRLALVLEDKNELIAKPFEKSNCIPIKLGRLEHKNFEHSLSCADILSVDNGLYVWHERQLIKFDLSTKPPVKVFDQKFNFETSDKGYLSVFYGKVYLNMHDGLRHFFEPNSLVFHTDKESENLPYNGGKEDGSSSMEIEVNWPESLGDMSNYSRSYKIANGKIVLIGPSEEGKEHISIRHIVIFDPVRNTFDDLLLVLG